MLNKMHRNPRNLIQGGTQHEAPTTDTTVSQALATANNGSNDAIHDYLVPFADLNGSTTSSAVRYIHFMNASARAIGLPKSNAVVIAALPIEDRAVLALVRHGIAQRIPKWIAQAEAEGGSKPHNRVLKLAKAWATTEEKALRACGIEELITQAVALALTDESEVVHV